MHLPALGPWSLALLLSLPVASCSRTASHAIEAPTTSTASASPRIDGERMHELLAMLASDGLAGRYTLSASDIGRAAELLATQYREADISPVGTEYRHDFPIVTGIELRGAQGLRVLAGGSTRREATLPPDAFTPLPVSGSATQQGDLVFAGYAARSEDGSYDDLAGLDLTGKIALVLTDLPGQPSARRLAERVRELVQDAERTAASLRASGDAAALSKLHVDTRKQVATWVTPYLRGQSLPADFVAPPADPMAPLLAGPVLEPITQALRARPGPRFGYAEGRLRTKIDRLRDAGAVGVIVVQGARSHFDVASRAADELPDPGEAPPRLGNEAMPVVQVRWKAADRWLRVGGKTLSSVQKTIDTQLRPRSGSTGLQVELQTEVEPLVMKAPNVLATIAGSDLSNEIVILGAHYDHIGTDETGRGHCHATPREDGTPDAICNGADDNASGTVTVVELARALAEAGIQPRRTLVFAHFSGEEIGLLGSKAFVEQLPIAPPFAEGTIVAMVNLDMIGRLSERGLAVGGVGSSSGWMPLLDRIGTRGMPILYDRAVSSRSDHASFYARDIPVLFFFTHLHADYHRPGDETQHINREGMIEIAQLVLDLTLGLADGHALPFTPPRTPEEGLVGALPGDDPGTLEKSSTG